MKKLSLFILLVIMVCLSSCSNVDSLTWSNNIIESYNKTRDNMEDFEELILTSKEAMGDTTTIRIIRQTANYILQDLDKTIAHVSESEAPSGGDDFKELSLSLFKDIEGQIAMGLKFTNFTENTSEIEVEEYAEQYYIVAQNITKKVDSLNILKKEFIKEEGLE